MKMIIQIKHSNHGKFNWLLKIGAIFLTVLVFILVFNIFGSFVRDLLSPALKIGNSFYGLLGKIPKMLLNDSEFAVENERLLGEIEKLRAETADHEALKTENQRLRESLKLKPEGDFISAFVLAKPPQMPLDSLYLNAGARDGIKNGSLVFVGERILIGKIVEASKNKSIVLLNSSAGTASFGFVARTGELIEIKGGGGGHLEATVPIDFDVLVGDEIMTSGSSEYLIAIVGAAEEDQSSGFKKIFMSMPVDVLKVDVIFIADSNE